MFELKEKVLNNVQRNKLETLMVLNSRLVRYDLHGRIKFYNLVKDVVLMSEIRETLIIFKISDSFDEIKIYFEKDYVNVNEYENIFKEIINELFNFSNLEVSKVEEELYNEYYDLISDYQLIFKFN